MQYYTAFHFRKGKSINYVNKFRAIDPPPPCQELSIFFNPPSILLTWFMDGP